MVKTLKQKAQTTKVPEFNKFHEKVGYFQLAYSLWKNTHLSSICLKKTNDTQRNAKCVIKILTSSQKIQILHSKVRKCIFPGRKKNKTISICEGGKRGEPVANFLDSTKNI